MSLLQIAAFVHLQTIEINRSISLKIQPQNEMGGRRVSIHD